jgi:cytochrome o ubiquinol oxidase subunit 1
MSRFDDPSLQIWFIIAALRRGIDCAGHCLHADRFTSVSATASVDTSGRPWDGRTLEWSTSSPPPAYNFAFTPVVHDNDACTT